MRKLILAPMALACMIGAAAAQQAPTSTVDQGKPGAAPWPVSWTGQSVLADLRVAGNPVAAGNPVPVSGTIATSNGALDATVTARFGLLGQKTMAGSAPVGIASDQTPIPTTLRATGTNRSTTVGTTAVTVMAANAGRQGWKLKDDCAVGVWVNFDATATAAAGSGNVFVPAGGYLSSEPGFVETGAMSAIVASGSCNLTVREH